MLHHKEPIYYFQMFTSIV